VREEIDEVPDLLHQRADHGRMMRAMMTLMRTISELPEAQVEALDALCRRDNISRTKRTSSRCSCATFTWST
jgi:hypothetical protein